MSGRITYRNPQSVAGELPARLPLSDDGRRRIVELLGRPLTDTDVVRIEDAMQNAMFWIERQENRASTTDVRATLAALSKEHDAVAALEHADPTTRAHVNAVLAGVDDDAIRQAALSALATLQDRRGPRVTARRALAASAIGLWRDLGGVEWSASVKDDYRTPLVDFGVVLFAECFSERSASAVAKLMRDVTRPAK